LNKILKRLPETYKFFPQTWLLPAEFGDFRKQFKSDTKGKPGRKTFIVKPEASCQGKGVFLTRNLDDLLPSEHYVVQRYIHKPYLIDKLKFDLRIYVMVNGVDPLRVYFFKEGLCRLATYEFEPPTQANLGNLFMHLTNYAINKQNANYQSQGFTEDSETGHKRSLTFALKYIKQQGHDADLVLHNIKAVIMKTLCAVQPML
jgi:tubulin polyglutamylase TTLL6/13